MKAKDMISKKKTNIDYVEIILLIVFIICLISIGLILYEL
jgi:hypothetical protein